KSARSTNNSSNNKKMALSLERQLFQFGSDLFEVSVFSGNKLTQDKPYVLLNDIDNKVPNITTVRFRKGPYTINYMTDSVGNK
ncbi:hypothetical protein BGZ65_004157, partial [Modicella reniformis]